MLESLKGRIIGVAGWKDAGKTTLVEHLVRVLIARGFRVGTIKHAYSDVDLQPEVKDSVKHLDAGAETVVVLGKSEVAVERSRAGDLETAAARHLALCDVIIAEGFKHADIPKVAVFSGNGDVLKETENIVAVVHRGDKPEGYPGFEADDIKGLADYLLEAGILNPPAAGVTLVVSGRPVPINEFVQASLAGMITGFTGALRDVETPSDIQITLKA